MVDLFVRLQVRWVELRDRLAEHRGATAVEYALMLAFIFVVIVAAVTLLGQNTSQPFEDVAPAVGS
jgi:pilus assembly protein Flp/PilA